MTHCHCIHPEAPDTQYVSPGRGFGIRESMGWSKVCGTGASGVWVLKGDLGSLYVTHQS